jgi:hypothetical protein
LKKEPEQQYSYVFLFVPKLLKGNKYNPMLNLPLSPSSHYFLSFFSFQKLQVDDQVLYKKYRKVSSTLIISYQQGILVLIRRLNLDILLS